MATRINPFDGPVKLYIKDYEDGNDPVTDNAITWTTWTALDYLYQSDDGIVINTDAELEDTKVQGYTVPIHRTIIGESLTITVQLKKITLENLYTYGVPNASWSDGSVPGTDENTVTMGGRQYPKEFSVGLEGTAEDGEEVVWFVHKCIAQPGRELTLKKGDTMFELVFEALADTNEDDGEYLAKVYQITSA